MLSVLYQMHLYREFSDAISYNRLIELESSVFFKLIFFLKLYVFGCCADISFVNSTMILFYILRRYANKVIKGTATDRKETMEWCHGFKLHFIYNNRGEIITFYFTKANVDGKNLKVWNVLAKDLYGRLFANRGYLNKIF